MKRRGETRKIFLCSLHERHYSGTFEAFLFSMGSSYLLKKNLRNIGVTGDKEREDEFRRAKQRYHTMVFRLKNEGLLAKDLSLTKKGLAYINSKTSKNEFTLPENYKKEVGNSIVLVTFDIPENKRSSRNWLRRTLKFLGFELLQKSVWIGRTKIPVQLLKDIKKFGLIEYIEILGISKQGTIERFREKK